MIINSTFKTACFTGPRPDKLLGYNNINNYESIIQTVYNLCERMYLLGYRNFISGASQGFDMLAFQTIERLKIRRPDIKNIVYIPFKGHGSLWPEYGIFSRNELAKMLETADLIKYISSAEIGKIDKETAAVLLNARNEAMVNDSDRIIALYPDGTWLNTEHSGTANCMRYAKMQMKDIYQIRYNILDKTEKFSDIKIISILNAPDAL